VENFYKNFKKYFYKSFLIFLRNKKSAEADFFGCTAVENVGGGKTPTQLPM